MLKIWVLVVWFNSPANYAYVPATIADFTIKQECYNALAEMQRVQKYTQGACIEKTLTR